MNFLLLSAQWIILIANVKGHGRLIDPPSRVTKGRYFPGQPFDTTDMGFNCGGVRTERGEEYPKCPVCGARPGGNPPNEPPNGKYANDFIVKTYTQGEVIEVKSQLTANHAGEMEYRLCENNEPQAVVGYDCFNKNLLVGEDGITTAFKITTTSYSADIAHRVKLPPNVTCKRCILQWRYRAGNSWGGSPGCKGCGPQETFQACADIEIKPNGNEPQTVPDSTGNTPDIDVSGTLENSGNCHCDNAISPAMCHSISTGRRWSNRH